MRTVVGRERGNLGRLHIRSSSVVGSVVLEVAIDLIVLVAPTLHDDGTGRCVILLGRRCENQIAQDHGDGESLRLRISDSETKGEAHATAIQTGARTQSASTNNEDTLSLLWNISNSLGSAMHIYDHCCGYRRGRSATGVESGHVS